MQTLLRIAVLARRYRWLSKHGRGEDDQMELVQTGQDLDKAIQKAQDEGVL